MDLYIHVQMSGTIPRTIDVQDIYKSPTLSLPTSNVKGKLPAWTSLFCIVYIGCRSNLALKNKYSPEIVWLKTPSEKHIATKEKLALTLFLVRLSIHGKCGEASQASKKSDLFFSNICFDRNSVLVWQSPVHGELPNNVPVSLRSEAKYLLHYPTFDGHQGRRRIY